MGSFDTFKNDFFNTFNNDRPERAGTKVIDERNLIEILGDNNCNKINPLLKQHLDKYSNEKFEKFDKLLDESNDGGCKFEYGLFYINRGSINGRIQSFIPPIAVNNVSMTSNNKFEGVTTENKENALNKVGVIFTQDDVEASNVRDIDDPETTQDSGTTTNDENVETRLKWCHNLEQLYLKKHFELAIIMKNIIDLVLNIYYLYYIFNQFAHIGKTDYDIEKATKKDKVKDILIETELEFEQRNELAKEIVDVYRNRKNE